MRLDSQDLLKLSQLIMKVVSATLALAALAVALPTSLNGRQFQIEPPSTSFPDPIGEPPVTLPPDTPVLLPPITGPIQIGKRDAVKATGDDEFIIFPPITSPIKIGKRDTAKRTGKDDEFIIFPPITGPMIPDKPVQGSPIKPDPTVPGTPLKPSN